jgi:queuine tRNA-ribosyltransferase
MIKQLKIKNKIHKLPIFCPDATQAVVRGMDSLDLKNAQTRGVIVNTFHLHNKFGLENFPFNSIQNFMNFNGLFISDSGGFQIFSLIKKDPNFGFINDDGFVVKKTKKVFTPEQSIQMQFNLQSDIIICLDDFTRPEFNHEQAKSSVERTILWAKRCKTEYEKQLKKHGFTKNNRPLIFSVIQGHNNKKLREYCAQELLKIEFDGFGLGGWLFHEDGTIDYETMKFNASLTPDNLPRYALGFGKPEDVVNIYKMGYQIFDCVLPTRDARHKRLYVFNDAIENLDLAKDFYHYLYINKQIYKNESKPISEFCQCHTCQNFSLAYLHHLFKINETLAFRLATIHNLYFYNQLINKLSKTE